MPEWVDNAPGQPPPAGAALAGVATVVTAHRRPLQVLLVCTGNVCRSPVAEALLRRDLAALGSDVIVRAAGLRSQGQRAAPVVIKMLRGRGVRIRGYRSTPLSLQLLWGADLVLGMAVEHVEGVVLMAPDKWPRVFTLKELVRRSEATGGPRPGESLDDWLARLHSGRALRDLRRFSPQDDIVDPVGQSLAAHEALADEVERLTRTVAELLTRASEGPGSGDKVSQPRHTAEAEERRSFTEAQQAVPADAYTELGEQVAAVMRTAAAQASAVRHDAERDARRLRSQAEEDAVGLREESRRDAAQLLRTAEEESAMLRRQADDQRERARREATDLLQAATTESAALRDEADRYAKSTRSQAEADARTIRADAGREASELLREANARYAALVVAEGELRNRLEGAAGALVSALEGRQMPSPRLALLRSDEEELDQRPSAEPHSFP